MLYGPDLAAALEAGQLVVSTQRPLPRRKLGHGVVILDTSYASTFPWQSRSSVTPSFTR